MPIDTAVAATTSETARATVANSSMPRRRLAKLLCAMGDAKPTFPVSSVMVIASLAIRVLAFRIKFCMVAKRNAMTWAKPLKNKGDCVIFG